MESVCSFGRRGDGDVEFYFLNGSRLLPHLGSGLLAPDLLDLFDIAIFRERLILLVLDVFSEYVHEAAVYRDIALGQQDLQRGVDQIEMDRFIAKTFFSGLKFRLDAGQ